MENPVRVQEDERLEDLPRETLHLLRRERLSYLFHVFLKIVFEVLEHQVELFLREQDLFESTTQDNFRYAQVNLLTQRRLDVSDSLRVRFL